ncbi:hypothetical protein B9J09_02475 [Xylella fastidiosa subsp. pauca]|uniref:Uncharacterized protein n=1 Tax=Xylella fastidiosa TaxID=2371 RepID=A0ABC8ABY4_XYLFS|nr:hypothetical protein [Xylella fastidiosa]ALR05917.1 hypothetical protein XFHB_02545 [Xylella fastidiosa]ARO68077.1 hypothetical protein B9J09_02475 [Xylella fastidiosa subsp. pauca]AVI20246.1 hypothetical protein BCV75_02320 [Xylella fastidiosa]AVI22249.1 hypothetical protein BC375_02345 [Xylella fastidiosa]KIA59249.1 hypothetical protein RA12_02345 [Xylella fastidiosa]
MNNYRQECEKRRTNTHGMFIATHGDTESVLSECRNVLSQKTIFLCSLQEFIMLLQRQGDLTALLKRKSQAAILEKNPFLEILL